MNSKTYRFGVLALILLMFVILVSSKDRLTAATNHAIFVPIVSKPHDKDLTISKIEITQAIQRVDNSVPLVANKATVVRVFVETVLGTVNDEFIVSISATRNGTVLGTQNSAPQTVPSNPQRSDLGSTFNFTLPAEWLSGSVDLLVTADAGNVIPELNEGNNAYAHTASFNAVPLLNIKIVPIDYTHTPTGQFFAGQNVDHVSDWIKRAYPVHEVNISYHNPHFFSGDLRQGDEWIRLLNEITSFYWLPEVGAGSSQIYLAQVPISGGGSQWFFSGIAGIGWIGARVSVGLDLGAGENTGELAGHEVGHNFGRSHAPCGGPSGVDPAFPYANASIGEFGLDVANGILWNPAVAKDMMSYCSPEWVSDYTYTALYQDQQAHGALFASERREAGVMLRVMLDGEDGFNLKPLYRLPALPLTQNDVGDYVAEFVDADQNVLSRFPVSVLEAEEPGVSSRYIVANLPLPQGKVAALRLVDGDGIVVAQRPFHHSTTSPSTLSSPTVSIMETAGLTTLRWNQPDTPTLIRYSTDDGQSWTILAMDVLGGEYIFDAERVMGRGNGRYQIILADRMMTETGE